MLPIYDFQIEETEKMLESIKSGTFINIYGYQLKDTSGFSGFYHELAIKRVVVDQYLTSLEYRLCKNADDELLTGDTVKAINLYHQAIDRNIFYIPAGLKLTNLYIRTGKLSKCLPIALAVAGKLYANSNFYPQYRKMLGNIYSEFLIKGDTLLKNKNYFDAMVVFNETADYCRSIFNEVCDDRVSSGISKAKTGIYNSIYSIALKALMHGQPELAVKYASKAEKYRLENSSDVFPGDERDAYYMFFSDSCFQMGKRNLKGAEKKYSGYYLSKALSMADSLGNPSKKQMLKDRIVHYISPSRKYISESVQIPGKQHSRHRIHHKINKKRKMIIKNEVRKTPVLPDTLFVMSEYKNFVSLSETALQNGDFDSAYVVVNIAFRFAEKHLIKATSLELVLVQYLQPLITRQIGDVLFEIWKNQLDTAKSMYSGICKTIEKFRLNNNLYFAEAIGNLKRKLNEKECENFQNLYESWLTKARNCIKNQDFNKAVVYLDTALSIKFPDKYCKPDLSEGRLLKDKYDEAALYQQKLKQAYTDYQNKDFINALTQYRNATAVYSDHHLIDLGIVHVSISDFALKTDDNLFIMFVIPCLIEDNNCTEALLLLQGLRKAGYHKSASESVQIRVGECLAVTGTDKYNNVFPEEAFIRLNVEDEWFSSLKKAYIRKWKDVRKKN